MIMLLYPASGPNYTALENCSVFTFSSPLNRLTVYMGGKTFMCNDGNSCTFFKLTKNNIFLHNMLSGSHFIFLTICLEAAKRQLPHI